MPKHLPTLAAALAVSLALGWSAVGAAGPAQTQTPPAQDPAKPAPAPEGVGGKWTMSIQSPNGATDVALEVKIDEKDKKTVTGTLTGPQGPVAIQGEYAEQKLGFLISFDTANGPFSIYFSGALKEDGTMAGTADMGEMGQMNWTAKRAK